MSNMYGKTSAFASIPSCHDRAVESSQLLLGGGLMGVCQTKSKVERKIYVTALSYIKKFSREGKSEKENRKEYEN